MIAAIQLGSRIVDGRPELSVMICHELVPCDDFFVLLQLGEFLGGRDVSLGCVEVFLDESGADRP